MLILDKCEQVYFDLINNNIEFLLLTLQCMYARVSDCLRKQKQGTMTKNAMPILEACFADQYEKISIKSR